MKLGFLKWPALIAGGVALGAGGAGGVRYLLPPGPAPARAAAPVIDTAFVPAGQMVAPLVSEDGRLTGYVSAKVSIEVAADRVEWATARLPLLLHGVTMRTYRVPLANGPDGALPDTAGMKAVIDEAAAEAFGRGTVKAIAITGFEPG